MLTQKLPDKLVPNFHIQNDFKSETNCFDSSQPLVVFSLVYYYYKLLISLVKQCQATLNA